MRKILFSSLIIVLMLVSFGAMEVSAQPVGTWVSNIYCVNQEDTPATISLHFYDAGTEVHTFVDTIPGLKSKYYFPADLPELGTFSGSLMIQSDKGISCSVQSSSQATGTQANPFMFGASGGFDQNTIGPVMYISQAMKNFDSGIFGFYRSYVAIQNTSDSQISVNIEYADRALGSIPAATQTMAIQGRSNILVHLHDNANLPNGFLGSVKVSSVDGVTPLAVQSAYYNDSTHFRKAQFALYNGMPSGESVIYAPFIMRNFYDYNAGFNVVNVGDAATSFKIEFKIGRTTTNTYVYQLPYALEPGQLVAFFTPDIAALNAVDRLPIAERAGSAVIYATNVDGSLNSSGKIIANINFRNDGRYTPTPNFGGAAATYNAVGNEYAGRTLFIPNVQNKVGGALFTSGINIANLEGTPATCTFSFVDDPTIYDQVIPANGIGVILVSNIPGLATGYNSAAVLNCTADVIAIITNRADAAGFWGDSTTAINALKPLVGAAD